MTETQPEGDLVLERDLDISPAQVWQAWTRSEDAKAWFTPRPWRTIECEIDLRPGGRFMTHMEGPDGERMGPFHGCILEIVPERRLVWTSALEPGFRPKDASDAPFVFTCVVEMEPKGNGCHYKVTAMHKDAAAAEVHRKMGFHDGWGKALDQLVEHMKAHV
jgi:uncharacterized protein YndB with AHSA1/START domain